jgi:hypothetical protein
MSASIRLARYFSRIANHYAGNELTHTGGRSTPPNPYHLNPTTYIRVCPECAGPVIRNSGCMHCALCGWARCG